MKPAEYRDAMAALGNVIPVNSTMAEAEAAVVAFAELLMASMGVDKPQACDYS